VVAAAVISMGPISLPIMLRYGYDRRVASGVIAASGTLAQIIPPSLVLIVMADQLGKSVGDMYEGAFIPGIVLSVLYAGYIFLVSVIRPNWVPALPAEARTLGGGVMSLVVMVLAAIGLTWVLQHRFVGHVQPGSETILAAFAAMIIAYIVALANKLLKLPLLSRLSQEVIMVLMPPLGLIFLVLGTIFIGLATPTEGGAMGATGAMIIAIAKRRLTMSLVSQALDSTAKLSAFVVFILVGARVFSLTFYGVNGHVWVEELLVSLPGGQVGFLVFTNVMVFLLAFFLDFFELAFIVVPLLGPPAEKLGIDLIWFGVILGVNMQTSFMHPPFGFALFYLRSVAPKNPYIDKVTGKETEPVTTGQIYWGAVPFVIIQCIMVALVIIFPQMVMHYKGTQQQIDPAKIEQQLKNLTIPGFDSPAGLPGLTPPGGGLPGLSPPPGLAPPGLEPPKAP
jgi:tripartite ATP-independent transporter DctM subunit